MLLLSALDHPGNQRACKRCVRRVIARVADQLGHTPAAPRRRPITIETLREIEPIVARYLGNFRKRLRA